MAIRYDKKLNNEINKTIRNFNQKVARLEKSARNLIIPEKITKKEITENVYTRTELKRKLQELKRYSQRGIEETMTTHGGVQISKYQFENIKRETRRVKANLTREINIMKVKAPKVFGKEQATTFAQTGDDYYLNLLAKRKAFEKGDLSRLTPQQLQNYTELLRKTSKSKNYYNNVFKENYIKMLTDIGYYFVDGDTTDKLKEKLMKLDSDKFLKLFREEKSIQSILYYYPTVTSKFDEYTGMYINPYDLQEDIENLYNALLTNIDDILKEYKYA